MIVTLCIVGWLVCAWIAFVTFKKWWLAAFPDFNADDRKFALLASLLFGPVAIAVNLLFMAFLAGGRGAK